MYNCWIRDRNKYWAIYLLLLFGCSASTIYKNNIYYAKDISRPHAKVYFIRPFTYRDKGIADNPVTIELNKNKLLSLAKGEYALLNIVPMKGVITTRSYSKYTDKPVPVLLSRDITIEFEEGNTYFIHVKQVNEEFRGIYYLPELVDLGTAKNLSDGIGAASLARGAPISGL